MPVVAIPGSFVGDGLREGAEGDAEFTFGSLRGEVLAVAFEQDTGAGAGGRGLAAARPRGKLEAG
jgi:hypothetical protein